MSKINKIANIFGGIAKNAASHYSYVEFCEIVTSLELLKYAINALPDITRKQILRYAPGQDKITAVVSNDIDYNRVLPAHCMTRWNELRTKKTVVSAPVAGLALGMLAENGEIDISFVGGSAKVAPKMIIHEKQGDFEDVDCSVFSEMFCVDQKVTEVFTRRNVVDVAPTNAVVCAVAKSLRGSIDVKTVKKEEDKTFEISKIISGNSFVAEERKFVDNDGRMSSVHSVAGVWYNALSNPELAEFYREAKGNREILQVDIDLAMGIVADQSSGANINFYGLLDKATLQSVPPLMNSLNGESFSQISLNLLEKKEAMIPIVNKRSKLCMKNWDVGGSGMNCPMKFVPAFALITGPRAEFNESWTECGNRRLKCDYAGAAGGRLYRAFDHYFEQGVVYDIRVCNVAKDKVAEAKRWRIPFWECRSIESHVKSRGAQVFLSDIFLPQIDSEISKVARTTKFAADLLRGKIIVFEGSERDLGEYDYIVCKGFAGDYVDYFAECYPFFALDTSRPTSKEVIFIKTKKNNLCPSGSYEQFLKNRVFKITNANELESFFRFKLSRTIKFQDLHNRLALYSVGYGCNTGFNFFRGWGLCKEQMPYVTAGKRHFTIYGDYSSEGGDDVLDMGRVLNIEVPPNRDPFAAMSDDDELGAGIESLESVATRITGVINSGNGEGGKDEVPPDKIDVDLVRRSRLKTLDQKNT